MVKLIFVKHLIQKFSSNHYMQFDFNDLKFWSTKTTSRDRENRSFQPKAAQEHLNFQYWKLS